MAIPKSVGKRYKDSKTKPEPISKDTATVNRWLKEISTVQQNRRQQTFENIGQRILDKYRNKSDVDTVGTDRWQSNVMFNVLWSNVQVLEPALYSRMPKVVVERTFKDSDPIGRLASEIAERATSYNLMQQQDRFNYIMSGVVQDRLLPGRGISRLVYKAEFEKAWETPEEEAEINESGESDSNEAVENEIEQNNQAVSLLDADGAQIMELKPFSETVEVCPVNWLDYLESLARNQFEVRWRAFRIYKTRAELLSDTQIDPAVAKKVRLGTDSTKTKRQSNYDNQDDASELSKQAAIWVIEEEDTKKAYWICEGYKEAPLKVLDNPNKLRNFWSSPLPLVATTTTESTYPTADYVIYQGLADELNYTAGRIKAIVNCIRLVGAHAASFNKEMQNITTLKDGSTWPIQNWGGFVEAKGFKGMLDWIPFDTCVAALPSLMEYQTSLKMQIDEITSMPDIVRGSSDPNDPVYTQQQKSHWTVIKLVKKQQDVQRYCRELISKMAQMIFEPGFFADETIWLMAGIAQMSPEKQQQAPEALALLRDDRLNTFRIDIETDSTIAIDEADAAARWQQYVAGMQASISAVTQITETNPEFITPVLEANLAYVRTLRTGRSVEGALEKAMEDWEVKIKEAQQNPQPPPPDPALIKAQTDQQKVQQDGQIEQMRMQMEGEKTQYDWQMEQQKMGFEQWYKTQELQLNSQKNEGDIGVRHEKNMIDANQQLTRGQIDKMIADMDIFQAELRNKLEEYKIYANTTLEKDRLEFDKQAKALEMQEKIMEEKRLANDQAIENKRIMLDHQHNMRSMEHEIKITRETARQAKDAVKEKPEKKESKQQPIVINNHIPASGNKRIKKNEDGTFESSDV